MSKHELFISSYDNSGVGEAHVGSVSQ